MRGLAAALSLFVIGGVGLMAACKSREFLAGQTRIKDVPGAGDLASLLTDENAKITNNPPSDYRSDRLNRSTDGTVQGVFGYYDPSTKSQDRIDIALLTAPLAYIALLFQGEDRSPKLPERLAAKTVLEFMELHRSLFHLRVPQGYTRPTWVDQATAKNPSLSAVYQRDSGSAIVDSSAVEGCLGNEPPHWSDMIFHFYCQLGYARQCYTGNVRELSAIRQEEQDEVKRLELLSTVRREVIASCTGEAPNPPIAGFKPLPVASSLQQSFLREYRIFDVFDDNGDPVLDEFGAQLNVFKYIMLSQTYAFDFTQQQAVINAFYGRAANPPVDTLDDPKMCMSLRPGLSQVERPQAGFVDKCDPAKSRILPLAALGY
jgi:hypothetical protein